MSSIPRHHAEWLSLLEISGPFLSMPVLLRVFPQGLDAHELERAQVLRAAHEEWADNQQGTRPDRAIHHAWVWYVLGEMGFGEGTLLEGQAIPPGLVAEVPEHGVTLRPDAVIVDPGTVSRAEPSTQRKVRMLIRVVEANQDLDKPLVGSRWQASVATQMMELLHVTGVRLGLVTNGGQWMLVYAPRGETTGFISWYAHLWFDEALTLRAFHSLLRAARFFGVPDGDTLEAMLAESAKDQHEVTDQLGYQVRQAVEILIRDLDKADVDRGRKLLAEVGESRLYEAALTVMMRLVFLLSAEERNLLPLDDPFYAENYAVSTLRVQLRELADRQGDDVLERRTDAWSRLLATFRAVYGGVQHDRLRLIAYGGSLFDPDRFPFLEGRRNEETGIGKKGGGWRTGESDPLPVDNLTVLHLLEALQILRVKVPGGAASGRSGYETRRLSFRALDIEQIGHVYEGLLDHIAVRAEEPVLGLAGTRDKEPEILLARLEALGNLTQRREGTKTQRLGENEGLMDYLQEQTGRSRSALGNALAAVPDDFRLRRLRTASNNDDTLYARVLLFAGLVRDDDNGFPVVVPAGGVYVTAGATRRATGTHYTQRSLTEPIVQHTLEPLVYIGPAEGLPRAEWILRRPEDLLALKICDMAMGCGAFLVQVVRYLAERLVESWEYWGEDVSGIRYQVSSKDASNLTPGTGSPDTLALAKRLIADRCIYGVDKNPLAVEMAKLSLWLITLDKNRPFTFLDHSLKCGDSLVGAGEDDYLRWAHRLLNDPHQAGSMTLFDQSLRDQVEQAREKRKALQAFQVLDVRDAERKAALLKEGDEAIARVKRGCDLIVGVKLLGLNASQQDDLANRLLLNYAAGDLDGEIDPTRHYDAARALNAARKERAFHWAFEFPEVFEGGGFSAFVGNPPFLGGQRISTNYGASYLYFLRDAYPSSTGTADLCAFFFLNAYDKMCLSGTAGLIATNTIAQGDTRETGLEHIVRLGGKIYRANSSIPWPGVAAVSVSVVHLLKGDFLSEAILDGETVKTITPLLDHVAYRGSPEKLSMNSGFSFIGSYVLGMGFVLEPHEAQFLIEKDAKNSQVISRYLGGNDINNQPDQSPTRFVINFFDWPLKRAEEYHECIERIKTLVKPERDILKRKRNRENWWLYAENRPGLYKAIDGIEDVLVIPRVSKFLNVSCQKIGFVYSDSTVVIASPNKDLFAVLQSTLHEIWVRKYASTLETRLRYTPSDCFETFPFPFELIGRDKALAEIGEYYYEHRSQLTIKRSEGLTATYNRFHDLEEAAPDIARLRELHVEMDNAVAGAYGWQDLDLGHGFHETAQGVRFTISEAARREVLGRLLELNHRRWEEEQERMKDEGGRMKGEKEKRGGGEEGDDSPRKDAKRQSRKGGEGGKDKQGRQVREQKVEYTGKAKSTPELPANQANFFGVMDAPEPEQITPMPFIGLAGKVFRSPMPFHKENDPEGKVYAEMNAQKVSAIVMLVSDAEAQEKSGRNLRALYQKEGLTVIHLPIEDFGVPTRPALDEAVAQTLKLARAGKSIAVHCSAGIGRTGLFLAELAKKAMGLDGERALYWVRLYVPGAVEREGQRGIVVDV